MIIFEKANVLHVGDLVFNRRHPCIYRPAGASIAGWITTLETVAGKFPGDTVYIYGHAQQGWDVTGRSADLPYQRGYLGALLEFVRTGIKGGKSGEATVGVTGPQGGLLPQPAVGLLLLWVHPVPHTPLIGEETDVASRIVGVQQCPLLHDCLLDSDK